MRHWLILYFLLFYSIAVFGQQLHIDSTRFITGINPATHITFAIPTADKGILFSGYASPNPGGIIPNCYYGGDNVLIGKIDSNQHISWIKVYGGNGDDAAVSAVQTADGGYAVLAYITDSGGDVSGYVGSDDLWLLRLDASGNLLWRKCYGSTAQDDAISIAATPDNGFVLLGWTNGNDGDVPSHYGSSWTFNWVVIKVDSAGSVQWSRTVGGTGGEGYGSILAVDNGYYIAATSGSVDGDCTDTAWHPGVATSGDYHLLRLDSAGHPLWDSSYGGSNADIVTYAMFDSRDSTIMMTGYTRSSDYMVTGYHDCLLHGASTENGDMWVIKTNKKGQLIWEKTLGGIQDEKGTGICIAPGGGYMAYGQTFPRTCIDTNISNIGSYNCWLFLLDNSGNVLTDKLFGGIYEDRTYSVIPYLNGYIATGNSASKIFTEGTMYGNFDTTAGTPEDAFVSYITYSTVGVSSLQVEEQNLLVYPNPTTEAVTIHTPPDTGGALIISNIVGQVVFHKDGLAANSAIDIGTTAWPPGLYLVRWAGIDGAMVAVKLMKN